jgi:anti-sigma-K factor RskA
MNPSAQDRESHELDKRLFDYLEGNLSAQQARKLEQEIASDATLAGELEHWKDAVFVQDFYDTRVLEEKLLLEETIVPAQKQAVHTTTPATLLITLLLTCVCSLWPVKVENQEVKNSQLLTLRLPVAENISEKPTLPLPVAARENQKLIATTQAQYLPKNNTAQTVSVRHTQTELLLPLQPAALHVSAGNEIPQVILPETAKKKLSVKNLPVARTITRKQARQIARMKERALQRRMANEFEKGRVPYVVPLNTRNF